MSNSFPETKLGEVLHLNIDAIPVDPAATYQIAGVYSFARGLLTRAPLQGAATTYKVMHRLHKDHFVLSQLKAWEGALARVPETLEGWFLSPQFATFRAVPGKLEIGFLDWYCKQSHVWESLRGKARGMGARRDSVSPERFLELEIPLPPVEEQRRIVARIEELSPKIEEARGLRQSAADQTKALRSSILNSVFAVQTTKPGWSPKPLGQAATIARGKFAHRPRNEPRFYDGKIPFIQIGDISNARRCIREFSQTLNDDGLNISRLFPKGTVVIAITGATIGATGILDFDSCFPDSIVGLEAKAEVATPEFIYWSLEYAKRAALAEATQTTQPNINLKNLESLRIPIPPLPDQRAFVSYLDSLYGEIDTLKTVQEETTEELNALMPSILSRAFSGEL